MITDIPAGFRRHRHDQHHDHGPEGDRHRRHRHHPEHRGHGPGIGREHGDGPGGRMRGGRREGGRGRAQRGDVRTATLLLLAEQPMHGYQLMQAIAERTQGAWRPSPGAVYPTLAQLEDEGLVTVTAEGGRRQATLTEVGQAFVAENRDTLPDPFAGITAEAGGDADLRGPLQELHVASRQVAVSGTVEQVRAARRVLTEARRALYLILAGEPAGDQATSGSAGQADAVGTAPAADAQG